MFNNKIGFNIEKKIISIFHIWYPLVK